MERNCPDILQRFREITAGCVICEPRLSLCQRREVAVGILTLGKVLGTAVNTSLPAWGGGCVISDSGRSWHVQTSSLSVRRVRKELEGGSSPSQPRGWSSCKGPPYSQRSPAGRDISVWTSIQKPRTGVIYLGADLNSSDKERIFQGLPPNGDVLHLSCFLLENLVNPAQSRRLQCS